MERSRDCSSPDLLPSDITGSVYRSDSSDFEFKPGPIFNHVVLADEINRAPPRTQSALLEAMSDGSVSIDGVTHPLPKPFIVVATQNPRIRRNLRSSREPNGSFPLRSSIGYPSREVEKQVLSTHRFGEPVEDLKPVVSAEQITHAQEAARSVRFDDSLVDYLLQIVEATRSDTRFQVGVSTRGALSFYRGCQARAITEQRDFVTPDDIKALATPCLSHRLVGETIFGEDGNSTSEQHLREMISTIPYPCRQVKSSVLIATDR